MGLEHSEANSILLRSPVSQRAIWRERIIVHNVHIFTKKRDTYVDFTEFACFS